MITHLARKELFWMALAFLFAGMLAISVVAYHYHKESKLESSGEVIIGTVDSKRIEYASNEKGPPTKLFMVAYHFKAPDGSSQNGEGAVDQSFYDTVEAGDEIEVLYDTNAPSRHRLVATEPAGGTMSLVFVAAGVLFALRGLLLLWNAVREAARHRA